MSTSTPAEGTAENGVMNRTLQGVVVSDAMDKTVVVAVDRVRIHPLYKKRYTTSKKYKVHDERNQFKKGDTVDFVACRPMSKDKTWRVVYSPATN